MQILIARGMIRGWLAATGLGVALTLTACASASSTPTAAPAAAAPTTAPVATPAAVATPTAVATAPAATATKAPVPTVAPTVAKSPALLTRVDATLGTILTSTDGKTLYKFNRDTPGVSACVDACAKTWPPLAPPAGDLNAPPGVTGALTSITRPDGTKQIAYNGSPLYNYSADVAPTDTKGQGVGGVWFIVNP